MNFEKQIKNLKVYNEFKNALLCDKLSQAYLFSCPDRLTSKTLLLELSKLLQCNNKDACNICDNCVKINAGTHPDVLIYPLAQSFVVEDASSIYNNVQIKPMLAKYKVFIINDIDLSTEQAQNKMLKILEEPPVNVIFLISTASQQKILPTILSRVQKMVVDKMSSEDIKQVFTDIDFNTLQIAIGFGEGYIGKTLDIINNKTFLDNFKNMLNLIKNMKNSSQIPYFSPFFVKDKNCFENNLVILNSLYRDLLMYLLNEKKLINNTFLVKEFEELSIEYTSMAVTNILKRINKIKQMLDSNVNLTVLADNFLFDILEIKYLCK